MVSSYLANILKFCYVQVIFLCWPSEIYCVVYSTILFSSPIDICFYGRYPKTPVSHICEDPKLDTTRDV